MIVITTTGRRLSGPGSNAPDSVPCRRLGRDRRTPESGQRARSRPTWPHSTSTSGSMPASSTRTTSVSSSWYLSIGSMPEGVGPSFPVSRQRMVVPSPVGCERMKHVDLVGLSVEAGSRAPVVLVREHDAPRRVLPIFVGPNEAVAIALGLRDEPPLSRPLTHDLMATLVETLDVHVDRVEVTELRDGTLLAEVALSGPTGQRRLDSRPSDAVALAVRVDAPLFVSAAVDDEAIDEEVARFRSLLDALGPADFQTGPGGERAPGTPPDDLADDDSEPDSGPDDPPYSPDA